MVVYFDAVFFCYVSGDLRFQTLRTLVSKGWQKEVFGDPFRSDFEVSGESESGAPVCTGAPFLRFEGIKKAMDFDYFWKGSQGARE